MNRNGSLDGQHVGARGGIPPRHAVKSKVALLTGGSDRPYALGLAMALVAKGVPLDFIGSNELDSLELRSSPMVTFLNLRGDQTEDASLARKIVRVLVYYIRLICYAANAEPKIFHILWNNRFEFFDRTLLMLYYKLQGKRIVLTAHNVNAGRRDSRDSLLNRLTLTVQYRLADHIFVHTEAMKKELREDFAVREDAITVIPLGINNSVPLTDVTPGLAKQRLGLGTGEKTILFFGRIGPYKGLDLLVAAFRRLITHDSSYRLIIAGKPTRGSDAYADRIQRQIACAGLQERVLQRIGYIPDNETELYFKAADVLVLPYREVFQSGVLILGYSFGLPVIAADVGSFKEEIVQGTTGFLCRPSDSIDLARTIAVYFQTDLFTELAGRRSEIRDFACRRYSWDTVSQATRTVYEALLAR
jgi:D-inositol-3-phosphate glycosyltransferase